MGADQLNLGRGHCQKFAPVQIVHLSKSITNQPQTEYVATCSFWGKVCVV